MAKKNIIDLIWKSAKLEGINITFEETQVIYNGGNVEHLRDDEILIISNLKSAWKFLFATIESKLDFNYISSIHSLVGANLVESPGKIRIYDVKISGTKWSPKLPEISDYENLSKGIELVDCDTKRAIIFMCKLMKLQLFNDGNKRTAMLIANHELIKYGRGLISISDEYRTEFCKKLIEYYEDEQKLNELISFIYDNCLS